MVRIRGIAKLADTEYLRFGPDVTVPDEAPLTVEYGMDIVGRARCHRLENGDIEVEADVTDTVLQDVLRRHITQFGFLTDVSAEASERHNAVHAAGGDWQRETLDEGRVLSVSIIGSHVEPRQPHWEVM